MRKVFVIARREYLAMVGSKAFLISIAIMPVFMLGGAVVPQLMRDRVDTNDKRIVVLDQSGTLTRAWSRRSRCAMSMALAIRRAASRRPPPIGSKPCPVGSGHGRAAIGVCPIACGKENLYGFVEIPARCAGDRLPMGSRP